MPRPLRLVEPDSVDEVALVRAAARRDAEASEQLFLRTAPDLTAWVSRVLLGADDAQDVVQDTFVTAMLGLRKLKDPSAFRGWLRTIALSHIRRRFRKQRLLRRLGFASVEPVEIEAVVSADAPAEVAQEVRQVAELLRRLPAEEGLALVMQRIEGMKLEEIAEHLGSSVTTVKRRLDSALTHFHALQERQR